MKLTLSTHTLQDDLSVKARGPTDCSDRNRNVRLFLDGTVYISDVKTRGAAGSRPNIAVIVSSTFEVIRIFCNNVLLTIESFLKTCSPLVLV